MADSKKKWQITAFSTLIFLIVVNPYTYKLVQSVLGPLIGKIADTNGCPTGLGLTVHAVVFALIVRYSMDLNLFNY